jgi:hypothetical protein
MPCCPGHGLCIAPRFHLGGTYLLEVSAVVWSLALLKLLVSVHSFEVRGLGCEPSKAEQSGGLGSFGEHEMNLHRYGRFDKQSHSHLIPPPTPHSPNPLGCARVSQRPSCSRVEQVFL